MRVYVVPENDSFSAKMKAKVKNAYEGCKQWYEDNKLIVWLVGPAVVSGAFGIGKAILKSKNIAAEAALKDLRFYDPHHGHYFDLSKKLTNAQKMIVDARVDAGETLGKVLDEMGVLK